MLESLLFARKYKRAYAIKIHDLIEKYGDEAIVIAKTRAANKSLTPRDRNHWKRIHIAMQSN